jgi:hypothetical protein
VVGALVPLGRRARTFNVLNVIHCGGEAQPYDPARRGSHPSSEGDRC